jgi:prephenate dehydrogenase
LKIAIVGPGLIGHSVALAARRADPGVDVVEIVRGEPRDGLAGASIIVLATPVDAILGSLQYFCDAFPDAVVLDTGSTKRRIVSVARAAHLANFVGGHPMAGGAVSGPEGARADLFDDKVWFLVPADATAVAVDGARRFVERLGARAVLFDDDGAEHDRIMAAVSHLPQLVASALMAIAGDAVGESGLGWAGSGLRDTTRLAASPASMWQSIFASNQAELRPVLLKMAQALSGMADRLDDADTVQRLFEVANGYRRHLD